MKNKQLIIVSLIILISVLCNLEIYSQPLLNPFVFVMPGNDTVNSNWLPKFEFHVAGSKGFIESKEENFVLKNGSPIKFYGVSLVNTACFPDSVSAIIVAKRLRKLGVNLVRFWGWDYHNNAGTSIVANGNKSDTINPVMIKSFDWFIYQLKLNGIYIHLVKGFNGPRKDDGVPGWDSTYNYGRDILFFQSQFQDLQKKTLNTFFSHVNPFTKNKYSEEPAIAFITLFNVNTLYASWSDNRLNQRNNYLSYFHSRQLDTLFNNYLIKKYSNTSNIKEKYYEGIKNASIDYFKNGGFESYTDNWVGAVQEGSIASIIALQGPEVCPNEGSTSLRVVVRQVNNNANGITIRQTGFPIRINGIYEVTFKAKTDTIAGRQITITTNLGFSQNVNITKDWTQYKFIFRSLISDSLNSTITFQCGRFRGDVFLDAVTLKETGRDGIAQTESLENVSVQRVKFTDMPLVTIQRAVDQINFYDELTSNYFKSIINYTKSIGVKQLFTPTNFSLISSDLKFQKDFVYSSSAGPGSTVQWDYNGSRNSLPYSDSTWVIRNYSLMKYRDQILPVYSRNSITNKPFIAENYGEVYPNKFRPEIMLFMPSYSALQNWSAIEYYYYSASSSEYSNRRRIFKDEFQGIIGDPSMLSLMPQSSQLFRGGLISQAERMLKINHDSQDLLFLPVIYSLRNNIYNIDGTLNNGVHLVSQMRVDSFSASKHYTASDYYFTNPTDDNIESDTKELKIDMTKGYMIINSPKAQGFTGAISQLSDVSTDNLKLNWVSGGANASILWTSLDSNKLNNTVKSLLTISTRSTNTNAIFTFGDSSFAKNWGVAPTLLEGIKLGVNFITEADSVIIHPLDSFGLEIPSKAFSAIRNSLGIWRSTIDISALGTPMFGVEQKFKDIVSVNESNSVNVSEVFPIPTNDYINLKISNYSNEIIKGKILNSVGEVIQIFNINNFIYGSNPFKLNVNSLINGVYYITLLVDNNVYKRKFLVVK
ncbi:MAG: T9SS type A sorting domain-containing protein [Chlorobiota bacterium]|nr:T9SS type A sorting domain-containing protein [Chlorobiota bacterium]QQS65467.1 MAG: T9SS type A sorting domain-containing protein [Chlorobiota bacterium]